MQQRPVITFVNHASFIVEHNNVRLICDPWLEGYVFNKAWKSIANPSLKYDDFKDIDYIWFSHEHPDHFNPPDLKKIPSEIRNKITILFQETIDKRVVDACAKLGFKDVIELKPATLFNLGQDFDVLCEPHYEGDSWLLIKSKDLAILNINDCMVSDKNDALKIRKKVGPVDILFTQFSYASWAGNKEDILQRRRVAAAKLMDIKLQCEVIRPKVVIPFASYVWFCHEENYYMCDAVNTAEHVFKFIQEETQSIPVVLYNGESYQCGSPHDSVGSINKYSADMRQIFASPVLVQNESVALSSLIESGRKFSDELKKNSSFSLRFLLKPTNIFLWDHDLALNLSLSEGLKRIDLDYQHCDVALSSESLMFCFRFPFGQNTLGVNGRYQRPAQGNYARFHNFFRTDQLRSRGSSVGLIYLMKIALRRYRKLVPFSR